MDFIFGFIVGVFTLLGYQIWRMMRSDSWDDSNMLNALRVISYFTMHPGELGGLYRIHPEELEGIADAWPTFGHILKTVRKRRPFWYVNKDEFSEVVETRE